MLEVIEDVEVNVTKGFYHEVVLVTRHAAAVVVVLRVHAGTRLAAEGGIGAGDFTAERPETQSLGVVREDGPLEGLSKRLASQHLARVAEKVRDIPLVGYPVQQLGTALSQTCLQHREAVETPASERLFGGPSKAEQVTTLPPLLRTATLRQLRAATLERVVVFEVAVQRPTHVVAVAVVAVQEPSTSQVIVQEASSDPISRYFVLIRR